MKQDKAEKIIQKAEKKAAKAAKQVELAGKKAEAAKQRQMAQAEKRAAKAADAATKKAAAMTNIAEAIAKKALAASKRAEEKKLKALAKVAEKAVKTGEAVDGGEAAPEKKKGKKKLLLLLIPVLAAVIGGAVWFFFLRGGGEEAETQEPIPIPMEYLLNETPITALPVTGEEVLVYQEEIPPEPPAEELEDAGEKKDGETEEDGENSEEAEDAAETEEAPGFTRILYRYEGLQNPVSLISAYAALMTTEDAGFSVVDETLLRIDPPAEYGERGSVQLARNAPTAEDGTGGGVQSLLLSWEGTGCSVTLDMPEGRVRDPKPEAPAPSAPSRGLSDLEAIHPSKLGLPGETMESYRLIPQEGSVRIAGSVCMRVNVYSKNGQHAGSYFLSSDGKLYQLDEAANAVVELSWE